VQDVINGNSDKENNPIKNAPHTLKVALSDNWNYPYSREKAAFPVSWIAASKYWPTVGKVDDAFGDRNLVCSCAPIEEYIEETV